MILCEFNSPLNKDFLNASCEGHNVARVDVDRETQRQMRHSQEGEKSGADINVLKFEGITNSKMLGNEPYSS